MPQSLFRAAPAQRRSMRVSAAGESESESDSDSEDLSPGELALMLPPPGPIPLVKDTESFVDVFGFSGVLPEVPSKILLLFAQ